jgi:hypothetical protein
VVEAIFFEFGQFSSRWNRIVRDIGLPLPKPVCQAIGVLSFYSGPVLIVSFDVGVSLLLVIEVV